MTLRAGSDGMARILTDEGVVEFRQDTANPRPYVQRPIDGQRNLCAAGECKRARAMLN